MAANGRLPASMLAPIKGGRLRKDAAAAWNAMNVEARRRGLELRPTGSRSSYRTFTEQQHFWNTLPRGQAAVPGSSNHGLGLAVDVPTIAMANLINQIGAPWGWQKRWSDAQHEWWHFKWREGHWTGPDPGPEGRGAQQQQQPETKPEVDWTMRFAIGYEADGRVHLARIVGRGNNNSVERRWMQRDGKWSNWVRIPAAQGRTRPYVSVQFARHPNGRLEMFVMTDSDTPWRQHQTAPNAGWSERLVNHG